MKPADETLGVSARRTSLGLEFETPAAAPGLLARMLGRAPQTAPLPPGVRVYAVGDIHGRADLLARARAFIASHAEAGAERKYLVFMGDYVDRGPDSKGVIGQLIYGMPNIVTLCLRGNHDQSLLNFLDDPAYFRRWKGFGGRETLQSYGIEPPVQDDDESLVKTSDAFANAVPAEHIQFLEELPYFVRIGGYLFVHAGFRPGVAVAKQNRDDMLWIREDFLGVRGEFGGTVVYGHTPSPKPVINDNRIGIDTGAYATGNLTLAVFEGDARSFYAVTDKEIRSWD